MEPVAGSVVEWLDVGPLASAKPQHGALYTFLETLEPGGEIRTPKARNRAPKKREEIGVPIEPASASSPKLQSLKSPEEPKSDPKKRERFPLD